MKCNLENEQCGSLQDSNNRLVVFRNVYLHGLNSNNFVVVGVIVVVVVVVCVFVVGQLGTARGT